MNMIHFHKYKDYIITEHKYKRNSCRGCSCDTYSIVCRVDGLVIQIKHLDSGMLDRVDEEGG